MVNAPAAANLSPEDPSRAAPLPVDDLNATGVSAASATVSARPLSTADFSASANVDPAQFSLLDDVELDVQIELGRTSLYIEDVLRLGVGSVVELDKLAGDPVDVYINQRLVARGEVLVLNDNLCVRVNDIISPVPDMEGVR